MTYVLVASSLLSYVRASFARHRRRLVGSVCTRAASEAYLQSTGTVRYHTNYPYAPRPLFSFLPVALNIWNLICLGILLQKKNKKKRQYPYKERERERERKRNDDCSNISSTVTVCLVPSSFISKYSLFTLEERWRIILGSILYYYY